MRNENPIRLTRERRDNMLALIKKYFLDERGEEIGDLASDLILDFIVEKLAPEFYNQGVQDAHTYMKDAAEDVLSLIK
jgi:uncharacterized protein (DUF2164 family)